MIWVEEDKRDLCEDGKSAYYGEGRKRNNQQCERYHWEMKDQSSGRRCSDEPKKQEKEGNVSNVYVEESVDFWRFLLLGCFVAGALSLCA